MKAKHTPGPWRHVPHFQNGEHCATYYIGTPSSVGPESISRCTAVASNSSFPLTAEETEANARLIAASPDLLRACKAIAELEGCPSMGGVMLEAARDSALAAIAKAEKEELGR